MTSHINSDCPDFLYDNLIPDFMFHSWVQAGINDYVETTQNLHKIGQFNCPIVSKVGWIGNVGTHYTRRVLFEMGKLNGDIMDIMDCGNWFKNENQNEKLLRLNCRNYMSLEDLTKKYKFLIDIQGAGYSGRTKILLWSHRPLLIVERNPVEFFYKDLKPFLHYIPVKEDLSNLIEQVNWCFDNYEKALEIAENAYLFCTLNLTREACYKQIDKIIKMKLSEKYCHITDKYSYITSEYSYIETNLKVDMNVKKIKVKGSNDFHLFINGIEIVFGSHNNTNSMFRIGKQTRPILTINGSPCLKNEYNVISLQKTTDSVVVICNPDLPNLLIEFKIPVHLFDNENDFNVSISSWDSLLIWEF